jgi:hypothetical protein
VSRTVRLRVVFDIASPEGGRGRLRIDSGTRGLGGRVRGLADGTDEELVWCTEGAVATREAKTVDNASTQRSVRRRIHAEGRVVGDTQSDIADGMSTERSTC